MTKTSYMALICGLVVVGIVCMVGFCDAAKPEQSSLAEHADVIGPAIDKAAKAAAAVIAWLLGAVIALCSAIVSYLWRKAMREREEDRKFHRQTVAKLDMVITVLAECDGCSQTMEAIRKHNDKLQSVFGQANIDVSGPQVCGDHL